MTSETITGITILGATGTIGNNTLDVLSRHPDRYRVIALTANSNVDRLYDEIWVFGPPDCPVARFLASRLSTSIVHCGCLGIYGRSPVPRSPFVNGSDLSPDIPSILVTGGGGFGLGPRRWRRSRGGRGGRRGWGRS